MLKINLLPPYIYERKQIRVAIVGAVILFAVVTAGMLFWSATVTKQKNDLQAKVTELEDHQKRVEQIAADRLAEEAKIPIYNTKVQYIKGIMAYNVEAPRLYEDLAKYTYNKIVYSSVGVNGSTLTISAHAKSVGDCGRYLLNMYRAQHLFSAVSISGVPGWPAGKGGSAGGGMMGGGMMGGGMSGMPGMPGMPGMGGGMPGMGGGMPGMGGGASAQATDPTKGFDFTVTCTLVKPITPPTYGGGGGAASASPMGGMMGMMPGMAGPGGMAGAGMMPGGSVPAPKGGAK